MISIPVTLAAAAVMVLINIWLGFRIAQLREGLKVSVGDGGHESLLRRMRAQSNFIEQAPFFLILLLALELSGAMRLILAAIAAVFVFCRIFHAVGMEGSEAQRWRAVGMGGSMLAMIVLTVWAIVCAAQFCLGR